MRSVWIGALLLAVASGWGAADPAAGEGAPRLSLPLDCQPGRNCFIQSYVDIDPGPQVSDFACGSATYEGHKGVDFRVLSAAAARKGVAVLASADGVVKGARDTMPDVFARDDARTKVEGKECGNGIVLDHGGGWETQYCHMLRGSIRVRSGERVTRGQRLGDVGYSGLAQFAHVHLSVRHNGKVIDPFSGKGQDGACMRDTGGVRGLWDAAAASAFPYANGEIIAVGFTSRTPNWAALENDHEAIELPTSSSDQLLSFARVINARAGDRIRITLSGPQGFDAQGTADPLDRNKAVYLSFVGRKRSAERWPAGEYVASAELIRGGDVVARGRASHEIK